MKLDRKTISKLFPSFVLNLVSAYKLSKNPYYKRIKVLKIVSSGVLQDETPYVDLENGLRYHGFLPTRAEEYYYRFFFFSKIKKRLNNKCIGVAHDISARYLEPGEINDAMACAKFYDFSKNETVVEIGAFIGFYAMKASELTNHVIAIEAIEENYRLLKKNVDHNKIKNITYIHCAAWNKPDLLTFHVLNKQRASIIEDITEGKQKISVKANSVDNLLSDLNIRTVDFIRIQVNGAEKEVLEGLKDTLKNFPKLLISAIYEIEGKPAYQDLEVELKNLGYSVNIKKGNLYAERKIQN